jgi:hypothetical protein
MGVEGNVAAIEGTMGSRPLPMSKNNQWIWFIMTCLIPPAGVIVGIVYAAKDRVGPALALWVTSWLASLVWLAVIAVILMAVTAGDIERSSYCLRNPTATSCQIDQYYGNN